MKRASNALAFAVLLVAATPLLADHAQTHRSDSNRRTTKLLQQAGPPTAMFAVPAASQSTSS